MLVYTQHETGSKVNSLGNLDVYVAEDLNIHAHMTWRGLHLISKSRLLLITNIWGRVKQHRLQAKTHQAHSAAFWASSYSSQDERQVLCMSSLKKERPPMPSFRTAAAGPVAVRRNCRCCGPPCVRLKTRPFSCGASC